MSRRVRVMQVGLGPIGRETARRVARRRDLKLVAAVDLDPALVDRPVGRVLGLEEPSLEVCVRARVGEALQGCRPDVALVTTVSELQAVVPVAEELLRAGVAVVSSCEELVFPFHRQPELARRLNKAGLAGGAACLGTGINPGFVLDLLPLFLCAPLDCVRGIRASRVVDATSRRGPLQRKVGAGLTRERFQELAQAGRLGHRGLLESLHLLCSALGVSQEGCAQFIEPVLAPSRIQTGELVVSAGEVAGIHQGARDGAGRIQLDLRMYVGAPDPVDMIEITGEPSLKVAVAGGYPGDGATCAILQNAIPAVLAARPGLRSLLDLPPLHPQCVS